MPTRELWLHEEVMLLALREREGTVVFGSNYPFAIGGAGLAELVMAECVTIGGAKRPTVEPVTGARPPEDAMLVEWLERIRESKKRRPPAHWVSRIAGTKQLKHRVALQLARRGILRTAEDKVLGIFTRRIYPELDPGPEREIVERLREAIFEDVPVEPRTAVLVALAHHAGLLRVAFDKAHLKARRDRIAGIAEAAVSADATRAAIEAMQAAVLVATIVPTIAATSAVRADLSPQASPTSPGGAESIGPAPRRPLA